MSLPQFTTRNLLLAASACLLVAVCAGVPGAGIVGWYAGRYSAPEAPGAVFAAAKPPAAKTPEWTFQKLQDYLAKKGLKTRRGAGRCDGREGMWYLPGEGDPLGSELFVLQDTYARRQYAGAFFVQPRSSPEEAAREVAGIADVQQRQALAFRSFIIFADADTLARLAKLAP